MFRKMEKPLNNSELNNGQFCIHITSRNEFHSLFVLRDNIYRDMVLNYF